MRRGQPDLGAGQRGTSCPEAGAPTTAATPRVRCPHVGRAGRAVPPHPDHRRRPDHPRRPTRLTVTVDHDKLRDGLHAAGRLPDDQSLSAAAVRRLACDADIIPVVLGAAARSSTWAAPSAWSPPRSGSR